MISSQFKAFNYLAFFLKQSNLINKDFFDLKGIYCEYFRTYLAK